MILGVFDPEHLSLLSFELCLSLGRGPAQQGALPGRPLRQVCEQGLGLPVLGRGCELPAIGRRQEADQGFGN